MSGRTQKADLIVRVRYQNKLPPPPFPPRLLHIPTDPQRYASYEFLNPLSSERELPMIVDGELGMPQELGKIPQGQLGDGQYWLGDRSAIAPASTGTNATLHEDDLALLAESSSSSAPSSIINASSGAPSSTAMGMGIGERKKVDVSWLRRTEYLSSEGSNKPAAALAQMKTKVDTTQMTTEQRAAAIAASFDLARAPLSELRHPSKPHLRAESAYDVLPDGELWANGLDLVRFGEDPGENKAGTAQGAGADPRLPRAIFRPVEIPGEAGRIGYYLPQDVETATSYELRRSQGQDGLIEGELFDFRHVRDYEVATSRVLNNEFVFCFEEGDLPVASGDEEPDRPKAKRPRGAYFTPLGEAQTLRKRRPRRGEDPTEFPRELAEQGTVFWDGLAVQLRGFETMGRDLEDREQQLGELEYGYEKPKPSRNGGGGGGGRARSESDASSTNSGGSPQAVTVEQAEA